VEPRKGFLTKFILGTISSNMTRELAMHGIAASKIRRHTLQAAGAIGLSMTVLLGGMGTSQAADGPGVQSSNALSLGHVYTVALSPTKLTAITTTTQSTAGPWLIQSAVSSGPALGSMKVPSWESASDVVMASAGHLLTINSQGWSFLSDGKKSTELNVRGFGLFSGSWYVTTSSNRSIPTSLVSTRGTSLDLTPFVSTTTSGSTRTQTTLDGILGSLALLRTQTSRMEATTSGATPVPVLESVAVSVIDAAASGKPVGPKVTLPVPSGAAVGDAVPCQILPGEVDCFWAHRTSTTLAMWVTRTDYLTGKTTTATLPVPSALAGTPGLSGVVSTYMDGAVLVTFSAASLPKSVYAYNVAKPSQTVHLDGEVGATDGNNVAMITRGASDSLRVVTLPFGGQSAPRLIGVTGDNVLIAPGAPLTLNVDFSKPVQAGTMIITDSAGGVVASIPTPASASGSLSNVMWSPPTNIRMGTYRWTLKVTDNTGQPAVNVDGMPVTGAFSVKSCPTFTDVAGSNTFASSICWAALVGVTTGTGDGSTFSPSKPVSRGSMAAFLYRVAGSPSWTPPATSPFVDVSTTNQFYSAITWLANQKITKGVTINGKLYYQPDNATNRGAMALFLFRTANIFPSNCTTSPYADVTSSNQYLHQICWLTDNKIATGTTINAVRLYEPSNPVNRGAMTAFLNRLSKTQLLCYGHKSAIRC